MSGLELRGVAELLVLEDGADPLWPLREPAHVAEDRPLELLLAAGRRLAGDRLLQVGIDALIRLRGSAP